MSKKRIRHRKHANAFTVRAPIAPPDWEAIYGRRAPLALDVGCGAGMFTVELARQHPEWNVLGMEIRPHLIESVKKTAAEAGRDNVHAILANANRHTSALFPERSIAFVAVNFPDPWFKKRHHKRRVIRDEWLECLLPKLQAGAELHVATDYAALAEDILELLEQRNELRNLAGPGTFAAHSTTGIRTERELKHQQRGDPIYRLHYGLVATPRLASG